MTSAKRRRKLPGTKRLVQLLVSFMGLIVLLYGFVDNTRVSLDLQAHAPPGAEHPYDFYADGCLGGVLVLLAMIFLTRPAPRRWRKSAVRTQNAGLLGAKGAKRRRRSGYNTRT